MTETTGHTAPKVAVVIVAAGRGTRAGGDLPKQWRALDNKTVALTTIERFRAHPKIDLIVLVTHPADVKISNREIWDRLEHADRSLPDVLGVEGGASRDSSVQAGLEVLVQTPPDLVLIHDVARPLVSDQIINDVIDALAHSPGAAPAIAVTDALWRGENGRVTGTQDREGLFRAQTPQGFRYADILDAHRVHPGGAADDVEVARAAGLDVAIVPGEEQNMKITTPEDFARAEKLLREIG